MDGNSIRATGRITGRDKKTIMRLIDNLGPACSAYQDEAFVNLPCKRLECDEIWSFCYCKQGNKDKIKPGKLQPEWTGDVWTWTALCADTKLLPCWYVGTRDATAAYHFIHDLQPRLKHRVQLTTDGHKPYLSAVEDAFGCEIDYAQLVKLYGEGPKEQSEIRYSPAKCMGSRRAVISGNPDHRHISTSYAERMNLNIRMENRRFTRLTNGFSKKVDRHENMLAIYFMYYNFVRVHKTLKVTPAMEAGITPRLWDVADMLTLLEK